MESQFVKTVLPLSLHFITHISELSSSVSQIIAVLSLERLHLFLALLAKNVFSLAKPLVLSKFSLVGIAIGEAVDPEPPHCILLELPLVLLRVRESIHSLALLHAVIETPLVMVTLRARFLSFSVRQSLPHLSLVTASIRKLDLNSCIFFLNLGGWRWGRKGGGGGGAVGEVRTYGFLVVIEMEE